MINGIKRFFRSINTMQCISPYPYSYTNRWCRTGDLLLQSKDAKNRLFGKQVFVCVQVLMKLVEDQFFKNS